MTQVVLEATAPPFRPATFARALVREARPKQWTKNLLVFAAPGAAGVLGDRAALGQALLAFAAFSLAASGVYYLNDARDADADRLHPRKAHRPIAAGLIPVQLAVLVGLALLTAGFLVAIALHPQFALTLGVYVALTSAYTLGLKEIAVVELAAVAGGFVVRAVAGGVAVDVPISRWFLIVASFGSLFMVAGKRAAEHVQAGDQRAEFRKTLGEYPPSFLRYVWMLSSGVAITAYCLWAFEISDGLDGVPWYQLSIIPFVLAILRYALLVEAGAGGEPEDVVLRDESLLVLGFAWVLLFGLGVAVAR